MGSQSRIASLETIVQFSLMMKATTMTFMIYIEILYNLRMSHQTLHLEMQTLLSHHFICFQLKVFILTHILWVHLWWEKLSDIKTDFMVTLIPKIIIKIIYFPL